MTYIEFFDKTAARNICTSLLDAPSRVIFLGDNGKLMEKHIERYSTVFRERGQEIAFSYKTVQKNKMDALISLLEELVEKYEDCLFDITGGEETLLVALGIVYERHPEKNIRVHKVNMQNNAIYDIESDGKAMLKEPPVLSIEENIRIYGGDIAYGGISDNKTYKWNTDAAFLNDVDNIWKVCRKDVKAWNKAIRVLEIIEAKGNGKGAETLETTICGEIVSGFMAKNKTEKADFSEVIENLSFYGLLKYREEDGEGNVRVAYKNSRVKRCLTKVGMALEMKIFTAAQKCRTEKGELVYTDAQNGVFIDWDGEFHNESVDGEYDTENEIDVFLMHNMLPVFISCKNGNVTTEELYKLNTVAERFGGQYSKKVLVATALSNMGEAAHYLRQRAEDMHIRLLEDVQADDDEELERKLRSLWCN